jgi:hypothetical protein
MNEVYLRAMDDGMISAFGGWQIMILSIGGPFFLFDWVGYNTFIVESTSTDGRI